MRILPISSYPESNRENSFYKNRRSGKPSEGNLYYAEISGTGNSAILVDNPGVIRLETVMFNRSTAEQP